MADGGRRKEEEVRVGGLVCVCNWVEEEFRIVSLNWSEYDRLVIGTALSRHSRAHVYVERNAGVWPWMSTCGVHTHF